MGNHTIAERMFRHDPSVMLHAPLRVAIYADRDGDTYLAVDQPSALFASYNNPAITDVGNYLDELLAGLLRKLNAPVPPRTRTASNALEYQPAPASLIDYSKLCAFARLD
jgi:hypothetical protein